MVTRQLASAGSGKTFTLAKQFILLFISIRDKETGKRRLRKHRELTDSLRHILAITFTNKATGEMKQRIISKLAALAKYKPLYTGDPATLSDEERRREQARIKKIDYLEDFCSMFETEPGEIAEVAANALDILLNEFSDFQVSTIDSFFQLIMRTFTYEAELPDNFQLELDSKYVAGLGLDTALSELSSSRSTEAFRFWAQKTVENGVNESGSWNLFAPGKNTLYDKVLRMIITMESESFKESMESLRKYFNAVEGVGDPNRGGFIGEVMDFYDQKYILPLRQAATATRQAATAVLDYMESAGIAPSSLAQYLHGRLLKLSVLDWKKNTDGAFTGDNFMLETPFSKKTSLPVDPILLEKIHKVGYEFGSYLSLFNDKATKSWMVYADSLRRLALTWEIKKRIDLLMSDSNTLQHSDTNSILYNIIGDEETPFIYERIGSRLDHYLMDEFQDTSRLQWVDILPLLRESEGRGNENLIIGDPKQSIYRFRNADSSLITTAVQNAFPNLNDSGSGPDTNTNWRSSLNIVRFNNFLFHSLANMGMDYTSSYGDVIQYSNKYKSDPEKTEREGFVSMRFFKADSESQIDRELTDEEDSSDFPEYFSEIGHLITELRGRGFRQKDIAVLVSTHTIGSQVINSILDYNSRIDPSEGDAPEPIRFVSEDSLKVANAQGVRTIIEALKAINGETPFTRPLINSPRTEESDLPKEPLAEYSGYAVKNRTCISDDLAAVLSGMAVTTLPALIEQLIVSFVPQSVRAAEAPFLAALQDTILEFSENHVADIPTFLKWWDRHGTALSISSPESTDAVQIVTVHSAKGLEFGAVIIPDAQYSFRTSPYKVETAWLTPRLPVDPNYPLPPVLPVELTKKLTDTFHEAELESNSKNVATDKLNAAYVAFTRAKYELHILECLSSTWWPKDPNDKEKADESKAKKSKNTDIDNKETVPAISNLPQGIFKACLDPTKMLDTVPEDKRPYVIDPQDLSYIFSDRPSSTGSRIRKTLEITYGEPVDLNREKPAEGVRNVDLETHKIESAETPGNRIGEVAGYDKQEAFEYKSGSSDITLYDVNDAFPALHFRGESQLLDNIDDFADEATDDIADEATDDIADEATDKVIDEELSDTIKLTDTIELATVRQSDETNLRTGHNIQNQDLQHQSLLGEINEITEEEAIDEEEILPFSEIALLRETLGRLAVTRDPELAILSRRVSGRWEEAQLDYIRDLILKFMESKNGSQFLLPPQGWHVFANRPLIHRRRKTRIPDRIHISPDNSHAMVINFKLSDTPDEGDMIRLRAHVRAMRATGFTGTVEGWICCLPSATVYPLSSYRKG